jgi:hypothetical protein
MVDRSTKADRIGRLAGWLTAAAIVIGSGANGARATAVTNELVLLRTPAPAPQYRIHSNVQPAAKWHPAPGGPHVLYGTIAGINGTLITIRLRNGGFQAVDGSAAVASGNYSAPLFIGKTVSVDGTQIGGSFKAAHIFRVSNLNNLNADH